MSEPARNAVATRLLIIPSEMSSLASSEVIYPRLETRSLRAIFATGSQDKRSTCALRQQAGQLSDQKQNYRRRWLSRSCMIYLRHRCHTGCFQMNPTRNRPTGRRRTQTRKGQRGGRINRLSSIRGTASSRSDPWIQAANSA